MRPSEWEEVRPVLEEALERPPSERHAFIEQRSAGHAPAFGERLRALLRAYEEDEQFLEQPGYSLAGVESEVQPGDQLGAYRLSALIGAGGMSTVWKAERADGQFAQQVAVKIFRGGIAGRVLMQRFLSERQILASLNHPHIAALVDGGTVEGIPYLVMEFVDGVPIDCYCDERQLGVEARLRLFLDVCAAVHYAHQNLVVHRDIKPANILVCAAGTVKLLDFGIARLLAPDLFGQPFNPTVTLLRPMTPQYASPEQVQGKLISTASDVYSLGVLLYELLSGHLPYPASLSAFDLNRAICETDPPPPSKAAGQTEDRPDRKMGSLTVTPAMVAQARGLTPDKLRRRLEGDLDSILLKALRKEPELRYTSVEQFAEDIRRHLNGLPVQARSQTLSYQLRRFVARNRTATVAAGLVALTLVGGVAATLREAQIANTERIRAERRFEDIRRLANTMLTEVYNAVDPLSGATNAKKLIVTSGLAYLDKLAQESTDEPALRLELARGYRRFGDVLGNPYVNNLKETDEALANYHKSLNIATQLVNKQPDNSLALLDLARSHRAIGEVIGWTKRYEEARQFFRTSLNLLERAHKIMPSDEIAYEQLTTNLRLGDFLLLPDRSQARPYYQRALTIARRFAPAEPLTGERCRGHTKACSDLAIPYIKLGDTFRISQRATAINYYNQALEISRLLVALEPNNAVAKRNVWAGYLKLGLTTQNALQSKRYYSEALAIIKSLAKDDPSDQQAQNDLKITLQMMSGS